MANSTREFAMCRKNDYGHRNRHHSETAVKILRSGSRKRYPKNPASGSRILTRLLIAFATVFMMVAK